MFRDANIDFIQDFHFEYGIHPHWGLNRFGVLASEMAQQAKTPSACPTWSQSH
jgi:hypothetical protein